MAEPSRARQPIGARDAPGQILVLGRNRSGTKWLSNQVANHPAVAAITAPRIGVLEANLFSHFPRMFGDLSVDDHYYAFLAAFMRSSYFHGSGLPESVLYDRRHTDYLAFFGHFMDRLAAARAAESWLQKGSSLLLPRLHGAFPEARFLIMRRTNVLENVRSSVALRLASRPVRVGPVLLGRELASYYLHRGVEQAYVGHPNVQLVTYESLRADKEQVLRAVCEFLQLDFDPAVLVDTFPANTSYKKVRRETVLSVADVRAFRVLEPLIRAL
ncbi:MAG TPA: sulfotransferase, partial [Trueperaceae bacterium]|nr:sulfotransferase [Trueperaceae bacterium]